ncbi:MAG: hypothetical protein M5U01_20835 [Ardenticatenaceae bacterium]|nr:hypothetical protein [Ardenticatenaceae bacterium]
MATNIPRLQPGPILLRHLRPSPPSRWLVLPFWGLVLVVVAALLVLALVPSRDIIWQDPLPGAPPRLASGEVVELPVETPYTGLYGVDVRWEEVTRPVSVRVGLRRGLQMLLSEQFTLGPGSGPLSLRFDPIVRLNNLSLVLDGHDLPPGTELFVMGDARGHAPLTFYHRLNGLDLARAYLIAATRGKPLWWNSPAALLVLLGATTLALLWFIFETVSGSDNL